MTLKTLDHAVALAEEITRESTTIRLTGYRRSQDSYAIECVDLVTNLSVLIWSVEDWSQRRERHEEGRPEREADPATAPAPAGQASTRAPRCDRSDRSRLPAAGAIPARRPAPHGSRTRWGARLERKMGQEISCYIATLIAIEDAEQDSTECEAAYTSATAYQPAWPVEQHDEQRDDRVLRMMAGNRADWGRAKR